MASLYVIQQGSVLRKVDERLKVTLEKKVLMDVPMLKVDQVIVMGRVTVTTPTIEALSNHGIEICYLTEQGRFVGRLQPPFSKNSLLRRKQYQASFDAERTLDLAKSFVSGKLANMRVMLVRTSRTRELFEPEAQRKREPVFHLAITRLKRAARSAASAQTLGEKFFCFRAIIVFRPFPQPRGYPRRCSQFCRVLYGGERHLRVQ